jgi:hypothetical protein
VHGDLNEKVSMVGFMMNHKAGLKTVLQLVQSGKIFLTIGLALTVAFQKQILK